MHWNAAHMSHTFKPFTAACVNLEVVRHAICHKLCRTEQKKIKNKIKNLSINFYNYACSHAFKLDLKEKKEWKKNNKKFLCVADLLRICLEYQRQKRKRKCGHRLYDEHHAYYKNTADVCIYVEQNKAKK